MDSIRCVQDCQGVAHVNVEVAPEHGFMLNDDPKGVRLLQLQYKVIKPDLIISINAENRGLEGDQNVSIYTESTTRSRKSRNVTHCGRCHFEVGFEK